MLSPKRDFSSLIFHFATDKAVGKGIGVSKAVFNKITPLSQANFADRFASINWNATSALLIIISPIANLKEQTCFGNVCTSCIVQDSGHFERKSHQKTHKNHDLDGYKLSTVVHMFEPFLHYVNRWLSHHGRVSHWNDPR